MAVFVMLPLFRKEAIEARRQRLWGEVIITQPVGYAMMTAVLTGITLTGLAFLVFGTYDRSETVPGYIAPSGGLSQVYAARGGTVTRVLVAQGDRVSQGQPLVEISLETAGLDGPLGERLREETLRRLGEIEAQIAATDTRFDQEQRRMADRAAAIRAELPNLEARLVTERELLDLAREEVARLEGLLESGFAPRTEMTRRRSQALAQEGTVAELERQLGARRADLQEMEHAADLIPLERAERLSQLRSARSQLMQALAELEVGQAYVLTAPVDGRVAALQAAPGQAAASNTPIVALVADGADLEAHLLLPTRAAGLVEAGQDVRIRVDAFPFQRFGMVEGTVASVSRAAFRPGDLLAPIPFQEPVYRVVVQPARTTVSAFGEERDLAPGMTLSADITVDRRTFLDTILDPLRATGRW
ncbi:MAG: hypothetical protein RLY86_4158 [Pseudomonadota bacterium]|jgi:membrane fusion protein